MNGCFDAEAERGEFSRLFVFVFFWDEAFS